MDDERPDYVGAWERAGFYDLPKTFDRKMIETGSTFYIFVDERRSTQEGMKFRGRGLDIWGKSAIEGTITNEEISFTKEYDNNAKKKGGRKEVMNYRGVKEVLEERESPAHLTSLSFFAGLITSKTMKIPKTFVMKML